jgi:hypothetical protein
VLAVTRDIEEAPSAYHVVLLVRECLASISPRELERIPEQCRPRRILDESDIARYSRRLTQEYWQLRGTAADVGVLHELWSCFLRASIQIARLQEEGAKAGVDSRGGACGS